MSGAPMVWRRLLRDRGAVAGAVVLVLLFAAVPFAGALEHRLGVSGVDVDLLDRFAPPSRLHPLGADIAGRDELARLLATTAMGRIILTASGLSFLGLGIQPPAASWGSMLSDAQATVGVDPALAVLPGVMIFVTVIAANTLGDGLQAALDPRGRVQVR